MSHRTRTLRLLDNVSVPAGTYRTNAVNLTDARTLSATVTWSGSVAPNSPLYIETTNVPSETNPELASPNPDDWGFESAATVTSGTWGVQGSRTVDVPNACARFLRWRLEPQATSTWKIVVHTKE